MGLTLKQFVVFDISSGLGSYYSHVSHLVYNLVIVLLNSGVE